MENDKLPSVHDDPELWIGVLADNELTPDQRRLLVQHLDNNPDHWRKCAIAMMDQQFLQGNAGFSACEFLAAVPGILAAAATTKKSSRRTVLPQMVAAIAAAAIVFVFGYAISNANAKKQYEYRIAQLEQSSRATIETLTDLYCSTIAHPPSPVRLQDIFSNRPALIELESNEFETIWLTDREVPESFLAAMVGSGNSVEIKPYAPSLMTSAIRTFPGPLIAVEVKNMSPAGLLAQGEIR